MPRPTDVQDPACRTALIEAEAALDAADYRQCVHKSVEAYQRLISLRPDLIVRASSPPPPSTPPRPIGGGQRTWPSTMGVRLTFDDHDAPQLIFDKDQFAMSEAIAYFEYTLALALLSQVPS